MNEEEYKAFLELNNNKASYEKVEKPKTKEQDSINPAQRLLNALLPTSIGSVISSSIGTPEIRYNYTKNVAQPLDKLFGKENDMETPWYKPNTVTHKGIEYATKNKEFNDLTPQELAYEKYRLSQERSDTPEFDPYVYELSKDVELLDGNKTLFKPGFADEGAYERYKKNGLFPTWNVDKNVQTKNASAIEKLMQGNEANLGERSYKYASQEGKDVNPLGESRTEIYNSNPNELFGQNVTEAEQTKAQEILANIVDEMLTPEQKQMVQQFRSRMDKKQWSNEESQQPLTAQGLKHLSIDAMISTMEKRDKSRGGTMSRRGSMAPSELYKTDQYSKIANTLAKVLPDVDENLPQRVKNERVRDQLTQFDWNLYGKTRMAFAEKSPKVAKALDYARRLNATTDTSGGQFVDAMTGIGTDPANVVGFGIFSKVAKALGVVGTSALEGLSYGALDDALSQKIEMDANEKQKYNFKRTAITSIVGGVIGGTLAKVINRATSPAVKTLEAKLNKTTGSKEREIIAEELVTELENGGYLKEYYDEQVKQQSAKPSVENKEIELTKPTEKEIVKPTKEATETKGEVNQDGVMHNANRKSIEGQHFEVVRAEAKKDNIVPVFEALPTRDKLLAMKIHTDSNGRSYVKDSYLLSNMNGDDQAAMLQLNDRRYEVQTKEEVSNELSRRLEAYKDNLPDKEVSKKQLETNENDFVQQQLFDMINHETATKQSKQAMYRMIKELQSKAKTIKDFTKATKEQKARAKQKEAEQYTLNLDSPEVRATRHNELRGDYEAKLEFDAKDNKVEAPYNLSPEKKAQKDVETIDLVQRKIDEVNDEMKILQEKIRSDELEKGNQWGGEIDALKTNKSDEVKLLKQHRERVQDMEDFKSEDKSRNIDVDELRYREERRLKENYQAQLSNKNQTPESLIKIQQGAKSDYDALGIKHKVKYETKPKPDGKPRPKTNEQLATEVKLNDKQHNDLVERLDFYKKHGTIAKRKNDVSRTRGEDTLTEYQKEQVDKDVLTTKEIAEESKPLNSTNDELETKVKENRERMKKIHNDRLRNTIGVKTMTFSGKPQKVMLKMEGMDASNSGLQIIAALIGDENIGKFAKLGKKFMNFAKNQDDARWIIGGEMSKKIDKPKIVNKHGEELTWKDLVKPLFMKGGMYGQGRNGAIAELVSTYKWDKKYATKFYDEYFDAMVSKIPGLKKFQDSINNAIKRGITDNKIEFNLPNGYTVQMKLGNSDKLITSFRGKSFEIEIPGTGRKEISKNVIPGIVQSLDGWIANEMQGKGYVTKHDKFITPHGKTKQETLDDYGELLSEILESDIYGTIMKALDAEDLKLPKGNLNKEDIMHSKDKLDTEDYAGQIVELQNRDKENGTKKAPVEIMKEFMASSNIRRINTESLVKSIVFESRFQTRSEAKHTQDPFEYQVAMAHHSSTYNKNYQLPAPKGVDQNLWYRAQREIFHESRARLEKQQGTRNEILGTRRFYDENGKPLNRNTKTYHELLREEQARGEKILLQLPAKILKDLRKYGKNYGQMIKTVESWNPNKKLSPQDIEVRKLVKDVSGQVIDSKDMSIGKYFKELIDGLRKREVSTPTKAYFARQRNEEGVFKKYNEISADKHGKERMIATMEEQLIKEWNKKIPESEKPGVLDNIFKTDVKAIMHHNKESASKFLKEHKEFIDKNYKALNQMAKALARPEHQVGDFYNGPHHMVKELGLQNEYLGIIDQIVSIKAMTKDAWEFKAKNENTSWFKEIIEIRKTDELRSLDIMGKNPENLVKGWVQEEYLAGKFIDENGNIRYDAQDKWEHGIIPNELEMNKVGVELSVAENEGFRNIDYTKYDTVKTPKVDGGFETTIIATPKSLDQAYKDRLKITGKKVMAIAGEKVRKELGRNDNPIDLLVKSSTNITRKENRRRVIRKLIDGDYGKLFSNEPGEGMVKLSKDTIDTFPKDLQDKVIYVHEGLRDSIVGRVQLRPSMKIPASKILKTNEKILYQMDNDSSQIVKMIDRIWTDSVAAMKRNIVLKSPSSHKNALGFSILMNGTIGVTPKEQHIWAKQAVAEMARNKLLLRDYGKAAMRNDKKKMTMLSRELRKSELYNFEIAGLSTNVIEGLKGDSSLTSTILSDLTSGKYDRIVNEALLNQSSTLGTITTNSFSILDTVSRFTAAKKYMQQGMDVQGSAIKANGLYADMDAIAPAFIDMTDRYGMLPFLKWFTQTSPGIMRAANENRVKALAIGVSAYGLSLALEDKNSDSTNMSGMNPLEQMVDFAESSSYGKWEDMYYSATASDNATREISRRFSNHFIPVIYTKPIHRVWLENDRANQKNGKINIERTIAASIKSILAPKRGRDYSEDRTKKNLPDARGFTQSMVEELLPKTKRKNHGNR